MNFTQLANLSKVADGGILRLAMAEIQKRRNHGEWKILNFTPHTLSVHCQSWVGEEDGELATVVVEIPSVGEIRAATGTVFDDPVELSPDVWCDYNAEHQGEPVFPAGFEEFIAALEPDTIVVVSRVAASSIGRWRADLVKSFENWAVPGPAIRDDENKIVGCKGVMRPFDDHPVKQEISE